MRILWIIQSYEVHAFDLLAESLRAYMDVDLVSLTAEEQMDLEKALQRFDLSAYDRVMTTLRAKKEMRQWRAIQSIPNLVIFEYDACQNYINGGKYQGRFSQYYRRLGGPRLIVSGLGFAERFCAEGFDANFLPKGYDSRLIKNSQSARDIDLGFIGRLNHKAYSGRKKLIERFVENFGLQVLRTAPGAEYAATLNRIRIFISADVGLGEYMAKNFEAMAAGCVLATFDQGEKENAALGFVDMENVVLYRDEAELASKLKRLSDEPQLVCRISEAGEMLARNSFAYDRMGERLKTYLERPLQARAYGLSHNQNKEGDGKKIMFIIPYFGKWPFWFDFFLQSCRCNATIDWLLITDSGKPDSLPENVVYREMSYNDYLDFVSARLKIDFHPQNPYKLCDLKPLYGYLHEEDLKGYDFWGFGDVDVIYGDLRHFFTAKLLMNDVVSCHSTRISGHLAIFRNTQLLREAFRRVEQWVEIVCDKDNQRFDESAFTKLFVRHKNYPKWLRPLLPGSNPLGVKCSFEERHTTPDCRIPWVDNSRNFPQEWYWHSGTLTNDGSDQEFMYLHFLHWKQNYWKTDYKEEGGHLKRGDAKVFEMKPDCSYFRINQSGFHCG